MKHKIDIPLFQGNDPDLFHSAHIGGRGLPAVIKSGIKHWPAFEKWNLDYFVERIGQEEVTLKTNLIDSTSRTHQQTFAEFAEGIRTSHNLRGDQDACGSTFAPYFISNLGMFFEHNLQNDIDIDFPFVRDLQKHLKFGLDEVVYHLPFANIFIGPAGTRTKLHKDYWDTHTFICQISGHKQVYMFAPECEERLIPRQGAVFDPKFPDFSKFPEAAEVETFVGVLEPGDVLFVPSNWLHDVESLDPSISFSWNFFTAENVSGYISHLMLDPLTLAKALLDHPKLRPLVASNYGNYQDN